MVYLPVSGERFDSASKPMHEVFWLAK